MKMKKTNMKTVTLATALMLLLTLPFAAFAQYEENRGLFGRGISSADYSYGSGESLMRLDSPVSINDEGGISNYGIGETVPVGSGLLILSLAGAGYAALRRKRSRKGTALLLAFVLLLGFTQCKKEQPLEPNQTEGVRITLTVDGGNNGSRVIVDPTNGGVNNYASVTFENGDTVYVGYNNEYVGYLTFSGSSFSGNVSIADPVGSQPLHFYFLGGKGFTPDFDGNTATVNISDQTSKYPVISYAPSKQEYIGSGTYTAKLQNKCSIMSFNVTTSTASKSDVCIEGMNNTVSVNFATPNTTDNGFEYSKSGVGRIKMRGGNGSQTSFTTWAIVLPQNEDLPAAAGKAYVNNYEGIRPAIAAFGSNQYLDNEVALDFTTDENGSGRLIGQFSISDTKKVHFSRGNLRATHSNRGWSWSFAGNQYECLDCSSNYIINGSVDLFGWNGESSGADNYGISDSGTDSDYGNTAGDTLKNDWGHNPITNGGNTADVWRTLTKAEWEYLFNTRSTPSGVRFASATVHGKNGMLLLPDDWSTSYYSFSSSNTVDEPILNSISSDDWTQLEAHGAVFLPATKDLHSGEVMGTFPFITEIYWTSTSHETDASKAYVMFIANYFGNSPSAVSFNRHFGCHVRLARDAN